MNSVFFHVDMDAFFASVEQLDNPDLIGKPVIVGAAPGHRGVVSACSYEARKFGVHSAMPVSEAYRKCPQGIFKPVRMERYQEMSRRIMEIFSTYTPEVRQISIDEAFLCMTGMERLFGPPFDLGRRIKQHVKQDTGLTISIGIAGNRYCAKLASAFGKPDGLCIIPPGKEENFIRKLELKRLWGIGEKTLERLISLNLRSVDDVYSQTENSLKRNLGNAAGEFLFRIVRGIDPGIFQEEPRHRSISSEITFEKDSSSEEVISTVLLDLSHQIMFRLLQEKCESRTVFIKIRFSDFTTTSARKTLGHYVASAEEAHSVACELVKKRWNGSAPVRLIGMGLSPIEERGACTQTELFTDDYEKKRRVEQAVLTLRDEHGRVITKASLLKKANDHGGTHNRF